MQKVNPIALRKAKIVLHTILAILSAKGFRGAAVV